MASSRAYPRRVREAASLLGAQIRAARVERGWSTRELADRAGISVPTLRKLERGDPSVSLGTGFDVANLVGVPLFYEDPGRLATEATRARERVALLPQRVRSRSVEVDDDF